jgi:hypothetical protein
LAEETVIVRLRRGGAVCTRSALFEADRHCPAASRGVALMRAEKKTRSMCAPIDLAARIVDFAGRP